MIKALPPSSYCGPRHSPTEERMERRKRESRRIKEEKVRMVSIL